MISAVTILFFTSSLSLTFTAPISIYTNAAFHPIDIHFMLANLSSIETQDACICQCFMDSMCITATYNGHSQYCSFYFAQLYEGQLQLVTIDTNSSVISYKNKTILAPTILGDTNETVYGIWNTTAGSDSSVSSAGYGIGNYFPGEPPMAVFDGNTNTSYTNYGDCTFTNDSVLCGINTGFYITLKNGPYCLRAFRMGSGHYSGTRDPLTITLEGSNTNSTFLTLGSSWTLIYNGSTGLEIDYGRKMLGQTQMITNNTAWYSSYRLLVSIKRGYDSSVEYSKVQFFGY